MHRISAGSEHNVALTGIHIITNSNKKKTWWKSNFIYNILENGEILCWGWNEHGNCGNGHTKDVKFPEQLLLPYNYTGIHIGSGAAHSFAVIKTIL